MKPIRFFPYSLKAKIILSVGSLITVLMFGISLYITFYWQNLILHHQLQNTQDLTRAFSIPILDAMIYLENDNENYEPQLRAQIQDFSKTVEHISYIMVTNDENQIIAHNDITQYNQIVTDTIAKLQNKNNSMISMIYKHPKFDWIIEIAQPLKIAGKRWGNLRIAIDAEPIRKEIRMLFVWMHVFTLIVIIITLSVIYYLIGKMTNSLNDLVYNIDKIDLDSDEFQDKEIKNDEIGYLTHHFKALELRLSQSHMQLLDSQSQVFRAEKLASIGRLAAGVAHEINNPLNGIRNCLYSIEQEPKNKKLRNEYINLINEGVGHIESVVKKLLGFSRHSKPNIIPVNLNTLIETVLHLLSYQMDKKGVSIHKKIKHDLPLITADHGLIQEVVMNLLLNSYDAISDEGNIIIQTGIVDKNSVYFAVEDDGEGIPEEQQQDIFDPFYTTKDPGEGTGLGLSVSLGIIDAHNGKFEVESEPGTKTVFTVTLPIERSYEYTID